MENHQLHRLVTGWFIREALTTPVGTWNGWFRDHPLCLRRHEQDDAGVDYSVLRVTIPPNLKKRRKTEPEEMLQPLAELCERLGEQIPPGEWRYLWYYLELLDRDQRVQPVCWIDPELLYKFFPDKNKSIPRKRLKQLTPQELQQVDWQQIMGSPWRYQLATMDAATRSTVVSESDRAKREEWREWLVRTWRAQEQHWLQKGRLSYEAVLPWTRMLAFDPALLEGGDPGSTRPPRRPRVSIGRLRAQAGYPGLYWQKIPLYDLRHLSLVWEEMKQELYVTSVFNLAAKQRQDPKLWKRLEQRFVLPFQRLSHYRYLVRLREQKVLEWTRDEGKSLDEIGELLVESKLHPLDPAEADRVSRMAPQDKASYYETARRVAVRLRKRLRDEGLLQRLHPGRPPKSDK